MSTEILTAYILSFTILVALSLGFFNLFVNYEKNFQAIAAKYNGQLQKEPTDIFKKLFYGGSRITLSGKYHKSDFKIGMFWDLVSEGSSLYFYIEFSARTSVQFCKIVKLGPIRASFDESFWPKQSNRELRKVRLGEQRCLVSSNEIENVLGVLNQPAISSALKTLFTRFSAVEITKTSIYVKKPWFVKDSNPELVTKMLNAMSMIAVILERNPHAP